MVELVIKLSVFDNEKIVHNEEEVISDSDVFPRS